MPVNFVIHAPHPKSVAKTVWEKTGGGKQVRPSRGAVPCKIQKRLRRLGVNGCKLRCYLQYTWYDHHALGAVYECVHKYRPPEAVVVFSGEGAEGGVCYGTFASSAVLSSLGLRSERENVSVCSAC